MRSVRTFSIASVAALVLASPAYASGTAMGSLSAVDEQPRGSTRLISPGFESNDYVIETPDTSDAGAVSTFIANSQGGPSTVRMLPAGAAEDVLVSSRDGIHSPNSDSGHARVAPDGSFVTYWSYATDISPEPTFGAAQIYLYDTATRTNEIISRSASGKPGRDHSTNPSVSPDGRFIVFESAAPNLRPNGRRGLDLYLYEVATGELRALDAGTTGAVQTENAVVSAGGRYVAFESSTDGLVPGDNDHSTDVFRYDSRKHTISLVSRGEGMEPLVGASSYDPQISADGSRVCYTSTSTNLVPDDPGTEPDVFLTDANTRSNQLASRAADGGWANGASSSCDVSADGHLVSFESEASDLVASDPNGVSDVFVFDAVTGATGMVVRGLGRQPGDGPSEDPMLSADGRYVAFASAASNLTPDDENFGVDAFLRRIR